MGRALQPKPTAMSLSLVNKPFFSPPFLLCSKLASQLPPPPRLRISSSSSCLPFTACAAAATMNGFSNFISHQQPGEDKGTVDLRVPVYSSSELVEKLQGKIRPEKGHPYRAMYSSFFDGITLDPALMMIPIDDHMVHRGHGVFDTTMLFNGYLYDLDSHLVRFLDSASKAKISSPFPRKTLRSLLIQLAGASKCTAGSLRYWLSAGPGDFLLSPSGCRNSQFYAVVISQNFSECTKGAKVITSTVPMKPPLFAAMKNVNYLPNVHSKMEAEKMGAFASIWVDDQGYIAEGPNANVAFISKRKELLLPLSHKILIGCTAKRLLVLASKLVEKGLLKSVSTRDVTVAEAKDSAEMMFVSSLLPILPIVEWDEQPIGDGLVGELTLAISSVLWEDIISGPETRRVLVPYEQMAAM
ncbi:D-amino-acid transaminase, chloroplastic-like isoform X1 [Phoenix dactylifera]|uniref:D-amino-acid transaminase, chloroplastic-like isoform X1 n=1 Tax=Phoenix dactylifera TaxID=42345 RepID=A0A8B7BQH4_PHODC|nr:D-amino-acid transaminase, chloroplastic-like isoform X1 [Phoenix dactylifera]